MSEGERSLDTWMPKAPEIQSARLQSKEQPLYPMLQPKPAPVRLLILKKIPKLETRTLKLQLTLKALVDPSSSPQAGIYTHA